MDTDLDIQSNDRIEKKILLIRGERVLIDTDLAGFYGVTVKRLKEQVRRNQRRFPDDFMFELTREEVREVAANCGHLGNLKYSSSLPFAFTEHGAIMAANVLNSDRAAEMGVFVVRAFVAIRRNLASDRELSRKLTQLEDKLVDHDRKLLTIVRTIKTLVAKEEIPDKRRIGFDSRIKKSD